MSTNIDNIRATQQPVTPPKSKTDFNPRSREGSDDLCSKGRLWYGHFNPRSREGSDHSINSFNYFFDFHFNPRSREGSDGFAVKIIHF